MSDGQGGAVCPQCGSAAAVHSIEELAAFARGKLDGPQGPGGQPWQQGPQPGPAAQPRLGPMLGPGPLSSDAAQPEFGPMQGSAAQPQFGPMQGDAAQPQFGPMQGSAAGPGPAPGSPGQAQPGPAPGWAAPPRPRNAQGGGGLGDFMRDGSSIGDDLAGLALGAAARFIGRAISRRAQQTATSRVLPAAAARGQEMLRAQIEIAQRHPDLRACLNDNVIFLAGGSRALPMSELHGMPTVERADALVARLRDG